MAILGHKLTWRMLAAAGAALFVTMGHAQVFTVGEKTATADIKTDFKPTRVELPSQPMTERGRRELMRDFDDEQGFAHRNLPLGATLLLNANGTMSPSGDKYKDLIYKKGQSAGVGDRVIVTAMSVRGNHILVDLNGGPHAPGGILSHVEIGVGPAIVHQTDPFAHPTGCRIDLVFEGFVPELSGPEMKALLSPIVDFGVKTSDLAYAETLPAPIKGAIDMHEVLVGMNHRMVLAALGEPENKVRESNDTEGAYEEWIYGHQPQPVKFIRFVGDRVSQVKIAATGQPMVVRTEDEMGGFQIEPKTHDIIVADGPVTPKQQEKSGDLTVPTLKLPTEAKTPTEVDTGTTERRVQYPVPKADPAAGSGSSGSASPQGTPPAAGPPAVPSPAPPSSPDFPRVD